MLRNIKISVDAPYIDSTSSLEHTGTSYQVSKTPDFTNTAELIVNLVNDSVNKLVYFFEHDFNTSESLYTRTKYHFTDAGGNATEDDWCMVIPHNSNQVGFSTSNTIIGTPVVSTALDYNSNPKGTLVVSLDNVAVIAGVGSIASTSWKITDLNGKVVYELPKSTDYIESIKIPLAVLDKSKSYVVTAITHSNTNTESNPGRYLHTFKTTISSYFDATLDETLYVDNKNYIIVKNKNYTYQAIDVRITDTSGNIVEEYTNLDVDVAEFITTTITPDTYYVVEVRGILINGTSTAWIAVYQGQAYVYKYQIGNDILSNTTTYNTTSMRSAGYFNFNGLTSQTLVADKDNLFFMAVPETDTIVSYRISNNGIYPKELALTIPGGLSVIPNLNTVPLGNRNLLLDYNTPEDGDNPETAVFSVCDYNHVTKKLTISHSLTRPDERLSTGVSGSAVSYNNGLVYYVPSSIVDSNNVNQDLEMRVYDSVSNVIIDNIPLPVSGLKHNVTLTMGPNDTLYLFGGSTIVKENDLHGELSCDLINNKIFKFNFSDKTWVEVYTVNLNNSMSYRYNMTMLLTGDIFITDVTPDLVDGGVRYSYIYSTATNQVTQTIQNNPSKEHIGVVLQLHDGEVVCISSTAESVELISVLTTATSSIVTDDLDLEYGDVVSDLVIPVGEIVYVRDPYRYDSITIEGDSLTNTGKLVWVRDHSTDTYDYNDLIVTRDMTITETVGSETIYDKVVLVGDAKLTVLNE